MWKKSQSEFYAWAAGAFDAGGYMSADRVTLQTADKEVSDDLRAHFGGNVQTRAGKGFGQPAAYVWLITGPSEIGFFVQAVSPFLHPERLKDVAAIRQQNEGKTK